MTGKQRGDGRMKDDRKAEEEKAEWRTRGKKREEGRMEYDRKVRRRRQNGG